MTAVFGFDTSNYTTSTAAVLSSPDRIVQRKQLLPVKPGERGLRQSDAVFHHTAALPALISSLCGEVQAQPDAVCVSVTPRMEEGSYMPCFLVGKAAASIMASRYSSTWPCISPGMGISVPASAKSFPPRGPS